MDPTGAAQRLAEEYPSIAALPREMLEELASSPETMEQSQTQAQLLEALVDQLPAIQTLNAEHEALVEQVEAAAGTLYGHGTYKNSTQQCTTPRTRGVTARHTGRFYEGQAVRASMARSGKGPARSTKSK